MPLKQSHAQPKSDRSVPDKRKSSGTEASAGSLDWLQDELDAKDQKTQPNGQLGPNPAETLATPQPVTESETAETKTSSDTDPDAEKVLQHVIFSLGPEAYALPVANVVEISLPSQLSPMDNSPEYVLGFSRFRGNSITVVDVRRLLHMENKDNLQLGRLLVVRSMRENVQVGLVVDGVREITSLSEKMDVRKPQGDDTAPFLRGTVEFAGQRLHIVDPELLLSSSPIRPFATVHTIEMKRREASMQADMNGLDRVWQGVQETSKQIQRINERSQEIANLAQIIEDIADRTRMLALNASIKAAAAGESGRDFALMAQEVERLTDRSTYSARQLASVVESIDNETNDALSSLEKTAKDVAAVSEAARNTGQSLSEIALVSDKLTDFVTGISRAVQIQTRGSEAITKLIRDIAEVVHEMERTTSEANDSVNSLATLAKSVKNSASSLWLTE